MTKPSSCRYHFCTKSRVRDMKKHREFGGSESSGSHASRSLAEPAEPLAKSVSMPERIRSQGGGSKNILDQHVLHLPHGAYSRIDR